MDGAQTVSVLLVEDDDDTRLGIAEALRERGYDVATAVDGRDALTKLRDGARPKVIILDLMMPMNGWRLRSELLADPQLAPIPVIVLTAVGSYWGSPDQIAARIQKPFDLEHLFREINRAVQ